MNNKGEELNNKGKELKKFLLDKYYSNQLSRIPKLNKDVISVINKHASTNFGELSEPKYINDILETQFLIRIIDFNLILEFINVRLEQEFKKGINEIQESNRSEYYTLKNYTEKSISLRNSIKEIKNLRSSLNNLKDITKCIIPYKYLIDINHDTINYKKMLSESNLKNYKEPTESDKEKAKISRDRLIAFLEDDRPKNLLTNFLNNIASDKRLEFVKRYIKNESNILSKGKSKKKKLKKKKLKSAMRGLSQRSLKGRFSRRKKTHKKN